MARAALKETNGDIDAANAAEREMLATIRQEKKDADEANYRAFEKLMKEGIEIKRQREEEKKTLNGDEDGENVDANINPFTGSKIIDVPESENITKNRKERWDKVLGGGTLRPDAPPLPPADSEIAAMAGEKIDSLPPAPPTARVAVDLEELD